MINSYCTVCGLYISAPDDFAGGKGSCPRCKTPLRIPHPIPADHADHVEGLRYLAQPASQKDPGQPGRLATQQLGPSSRYKCVKCDERYESVEKANWRAGLCPKCGTINVPLVRNVPFPRQLKREQPSDTTLPGQGEQAVHDHWEMEGDFYVAHPAVNQSPGDSVVDGIPLTADGREDAPGMAMDAAEKPGDLDRAVKQVIEGTGSTPSAPDPPGREQQDRHDASSDAEISDPPVWMYLQKGQQAGPVCSGTLRQMVREGRLNHSVPVWREGLDGWEPLDTFPELVVTAKRPSATVNESGMASARLVRQLAQRSSNVLWLLLASVCLLLMLLVARHTFADAGRFAYIVVDLIVSAGFAVALGYAGLVLIFSWRLLSVSPFPLRLRLYSGVVGLAGCLLSSILLVAFLPDQFAPPLVQQEEDVFQQARLVVQTLATGDVDKSFEVVAWDQFRLSGSDFHERYNRVESYAARRRLIANILSRVQPTMRQLRQPANPLAWFLVSRTMTESVVQAVDPDAGLQVTLTLQAGLLKQLSIRQLPATAPAETPAESASPQETVPGSAPPEPVDGVEP